MVRDTMLWLSDTGSAYTVGETVDFATALNLVACFTPSRSPESNSVCKVFVKTIKRDYVRVNPRPDALSVLQQILAGFDGFRRRPPPTAACACSRPVSSSLSGQQPTPRVRSEGGSTPAPSSGPLPVPDAMAMPLAR